MEKKNKKTRKSKKSADFRNQKEVDEYSKNRKQPRSLRESRFRMSSADSYLVTKDKLLSTKLLSSAGGQGKDSRAPQLVVQKNGVNSQLVKSQNSTIQVTAFTDYHNIWFLALAPISIAIQRGWLSSEFGFGGAATAFQAWNYLIESYYTVMNGSFQNIQAAPKWFWETSAALFPCSTRFKTGSIQYKWTFQQALPSTKEVYAGPYAVYFGHPTANLTNGFPVLDPVPTYDPLVGSKALGALYQYMNAKGMAEIVDGEPDKFMEKDTSAFASVYAEWGFSVGQAGGMATTIQSEVKLSCPIMAKFAQYQQTDDVWRGFQDCRKSSGTASYIVPRVLEFMSPTEFRNKAPPIFKFYNFDEYFLTLSYILGQASERLLLDNAQASVPVCPLTPWQVQLILRQAIINRFQNIYAQDLMSASVQGATLVPMCMSINGDSIIATQSMKLPFVFLENVRSATRRTIDVGGKYVVDTLPILCRPAGIPELKNFTYAGPSGPTLLYANVPGEVPVSLIDFSYDNNTKYITATGTPLTALIASWNEYITSLGNALTTLGTIGDEPGISALLTTFNTRHVTYNAVNTPTSLVPATSPAPAQLQKKLSSVKIIGSAIPDRRKLGAPVPVPGDSDIYTQYAALYLTSTDPFYSSLWRYTSAFVQPSSYAGYNPLFDSSLTLQQVFQIEPFKYPYSDMPQGTPGPMLVSINEICFNAATLDIKTNLSSVSEAESELTALAVSGRGGFFTSIAGAIGEGLGIPGAREVANTIGALTGL